MPGYTWVPYVAAAAGACLTVKGTLIIATGSGIPEAPMAVLYLGGLLLALVASAGAGMRQHGWPRRLGVGFGAAFLLLLWIMVLSDAVKPVVGLVSDAEHVQNEVPVVVAGLALLLLAVRGRAADTRTTGLAAA